LIEAAYDLGAGKFVIFTRIVIPYILPGITSGAIVVFMLTLGNYLTPNLMGGKNSLWFTEQIYNEFIASFNWNQGAAFGFLLLMLSTLIIWLGLKLSRQNLSRALS
jgi:spermidine/putrescine transport system permease protein